MDTVPVISVIIPTLNRPQSLERCLDALASQTVPSGTFEVIVIDDGGDQPLRLNATRWAERFSLTLLRQQNTGPAGARNRGVAKARGDLVAFTDDDCLPTSGWLEKLLAPLREYPEAMVGGSTFNGLKEDLFAETSQLILEMVYGHFNRDPANAYFFASNNIACSKAAFIELGGFDTSFCEASEDRELCDRWRMENHPLLWIPEAIIEHRHAQDFVKFTKLHFRYGKGAQRYKRLRETRQSGNIGRDLGFHSKIPSLAWNQRRRFKPIRFLGIVCLLGWWEVVNLAGFISSRLTGN